MLVALLALIVGTLTFIVRRLGASLILFGYIYVSHTAWFAKYAAQEMSPSADIRLALVMMALGAIVIAFKSAFTALSRRLDAQALPFVDRFSLLQINRGDLTILTLRNKSKAIMDAAKAALLIVLLIGLCLFVAKPLSIILAVVLALVVSLAVVAGKRGGGQKGWLAAYLQQPDNYCETLLVMGLIVAFLVITRQDGLISGTVLILLIARFAGAFRMLATNLQTLVRQAKADKAVWMRRQAAADQAERNRQRWLRDQEIRAANAIRVANNRAMAAKRARDAKKTHTTPAA
jgi:hypothetical protein